MKISDMIKKLAGLTKKAGSQDEEAAEGKERPPWLPGQRRREVVHKELAEGHGDVRSWKRKPIFKKDEAQRLFARGLRVKHLPLRQLDTDTQRLKELGLPIWLNDKDVATFLGMSPRRLHYFACERWDDGIFHYVQFRIRKRSGGSRVIMAPKQELRSIQRKLLRALAEQLPLSDAAHGFRRGRSVATNARPHVGKQYVIGMDLEDFFPSVTFPRVRGLLVAYGYSFRVAATLALLMTESARQPVEFEDGIVYTPAGARHTPQGAPTSPAICNAIATRLDRRLEGLAARYGYSYTRYADDLTFSGDSQDGIGPILTVSRSIIEDEGFSVNRDKTRVMSHGNQQRVTGVVVNEVMGLSRKERRKLRAAIHQLNQEENPDRKRREEIEGKLAYLRMLNPAQADALGTLG